MVTNNVKITGFFNHWHIYFLWLLLFDLAYAGHSKAMLCIIIEFKTEINLGLGLKHDVERAFQSFPCGRSMKMSWNHLEILVRLQTGRWWSLLLEKILRNRSYWTDIFLLKINRICIGSSTFHNYFFLLFFCSAYVLQRIRLLHSLYKSPCFSAYHCEKVDHT